MKRIMYIIALLGVILVPFLMRSGDKNIVSTQVDTLVIVTPHNEAIRHEYAIGFEAWYKEKTGRSVTVDWRVLGGTSEITRYLKGQYIESFKTLWTKSGNTWSHAIEASLLSGSNVSSIDSDIFKAHTAFLNSKATSLVDIYFGGDAYDFDEMAVSGMLVSAKIRDKYKDWFTENIIPQSYSGEKYYDPQGRWFGSVISCYGILYNKDCLQRLGISSAPAAWSDLTNPRFKGQIALCDPTRSGSMATAFENIIQQQMQLCSENRSAHDSEQDVVAKGWISGLKLIQGIASNARYFTGTSQKVPIDVAAGDCAAGLVIDFYGGQQIEALERRTRSNRLGLVLPKGGTAYSVDPVGILRGAPHQEIAELFLEYALSSEGQALWALKKGSQYGPKDYSLRRMPIRKDFYSDPRFSMSRSDPSINPFSDAQVLIYHPERTADLFREIAFITKVMCMDNHELLVRAMDTALKAPEPYRSRALYHIQSFNRVDYTNVISYISPRLESKNKTDEVLLESELGAYFRNQYTEAIRIASRKD
jgi:ABC-type Fe3+ transport system substrate-binding protein